MAGLITPVRTAILAGLHVLLDPDTEDALHEQDVLQKLELAGGTYQSLDEGKIEQASHVIAHDSQCDAYARATEAHKLRTAAFWLWECVHFQNVFDLSDELYLPSPTPPITRGVGLQVTVTGFQGFHRLAVIKLLERMGATVQKDMVLSTITHIIAKDMDDRAQKLRVARRPEHASRIKIVNLLWVYDCIRQWSLLPEEPYMTNAPPEADPCRVPASQAHLPNPDPDDILIPESPDFEDEPAGATTTTATGRRQQQQQQQGSGIAQPVSMPAGPRPTSLTRGRTPHAPSAGPSAGVQRVSGASRGASTGRLVFATPGSAELQAEQLAAATEVRPGSGPPPTPGMYARSVGGAWPQTAEELPGEEQLEAAKATTTHLVEQLGPSSCDPSVLPHAMGQAPVTTRGPQEGKRRRKLQPSNPLQVSQVQEADQHDMVALPDWMLQGHTPAGPPNPAPIARQPTNRTPAQLPAHASRPSTLEGPEDQKRDQPQAGDQPVGLREANAGPEAGGSAQKPAAGAPNTRKRGRAGSTAALAGPPARRQPARDRAAAEPAQADAQREDAAAPTWKGRGRAKKRGKAATARSAAAAKPEPEPAANEQVGGGPSGARAEQPASKRKRGSRASAQEPVIEPPQHASDDQANDDAAILQEPSSRPSNSPRAVARTGNRTMVALSGMHTDDRERYKAILRRLGISCSSGGRWEMGVTHLVLPKLVRNVQVLGAMASGGWLLSWDFLLACERSHAWLEPDQHELQDSGNDAVAAGAPAHWRMRVRDSGCRAFQGLTVVIPGALGPKDERPDRADIRSLITAGGGNVLPVARALKGHADFAIVHADAPKSDASVQKLLKAKVPCVTKGYVVEWLAHPWQDLSMHIMHKTKLRAELIDAQKQRGISPHDIADEPSIDWGAAN